MKKTILSLIIFFLFMNNINAFELSSEHVVLYNMNEDKIIYEVAKDDKTSIASLTKIMTTLVAVENISSYDEKITLNYNMFTGLREANAAVIGLKSGQVVTYNDLLYGMFIASGADATRAIAISVSGTEEAFVTLMNEKAKELGMNNTTFKNTTGLDEEGHYSTANDIAILLKEALKNEKFKEIFTTSSYTFTDKSLTVYSTLRKTALNYNYKIDYIKGAKTGYTYNAGKCLASIAIDEENDIEYLLVTTNASINTSDAYHLKDAVTIYNHYFDNYKYHNLVDKGDLVLTLKTKYGKEENINMYATEDIKYYLDNSFNKEEVELNYIGTDIVKTNMEKGTKLGKIEVIYNNEILNTFEVYLPDKVDFSLLVFIRENIEYIVAIIVLILILLLLFIRVKNKNIHKKTK